MQCKTHENSMMQRNANVKTADGMMQRNANVNSVNSVKDMSKSAQVAAIQHKCKWCLCNFEQPEKTHGGLYKLLCGDCTCKQQNGIAEGICGKCGATLISTVVKTYGYGFRTRLYKCPNSC